MNEQVGERPWHRATVVEPFALPQYLQNVSRDVHGYVNIQHHVLAFLWASFTVRSSPHCHFVGEKTKVWRGKGVTHGRAERRKICPVAQALSSLGGAVYPSRSFMLLSHWPAQEQEGRSCLSL
jgi:hypothetical protein